jgi:hypothetical protein
VTEVNFICTGCGVGVRTYRYWNFRTFPPSRDDRDLCNECKQEPLMLASADPMMQFFAYDHLPEHLQGTSALFHHLASTLVRELPRNPERTVALRKLLEAKDCAVRARLWKDTA